MTDDELKRVMEGIWLPPIGDDFWMEKIRDIRQRIIDDGPERFLTWPSVVMTMFVGHRAPYIKREFHALPPNYIIPDPGVGSPDTIEGTGISGNFIHQAYHLWSWEQWSGRSIRDLTSVVEFGGGYGALAYIARKLGFKGTWAIHDFEVMRAIQRWYCERVGVELAETDALPIDLVIALYSLSEAPEQIQIGWLGNLSSRSVLIACSQASHPFIERVMKTPGYRWEQELINDPWTCYLFGEREIPVLPKRGRGKR